MTNRTQYLVTLATLDGLAGVALADHEAPEIREEATRQLIAAGRPGVEALMALSSDGCLILDGRL